jgi:fatty acid desaturase
MDDFVGRKSLIAPAELKVLNDRRSDLAGWRQAISHLGAIGICGYALSHAWGHWYAVPLFILLGMLINYLYAAQHELSHWTVFKTRWLNMAFGRLFGFLVLYPRTFDQIFHFAHHRHTQDWEKDPELLGRAPFTFWPYVLYLSGLTYWIARVRGVVRTACGITNGWWIQDRFRDDVIREARWHIAGYAVIAALSLWFESWAAVLYWLAPMMSCKILHQVQNITEHTGITHLPDTVHNTRTIRTWPILCWMAWNMQYHTAHHTYPGVPFHALPELNALLVERLGTQVPTISYLGFQRWFLGVLLKGPEPTDGRIESDTEGRIEPVGG